MSSGLPVFCLVVALALPGCANLGASSEKAIAYLPIEDAQPGRGTELAFFVSGSPGATLDARIDGLPAGWGFQPETPRVTIPAGGTTSLIVRVTPASDATQEPVALALLVGKARAPFTVNVRPLGYEPARAGASRIRRFGCAAERSSACAGVVLRYVLWLDDGTLVGSDDPAAFEHGIPLRKLAGADHGFTPLNVYVGGHRGTRPPEPYNSTGCQPNDPGPCYHPVIEGFDARLRDAGDGAGMRAGETLAVRIPKEKAYHVPGSEQSPLYDANLNFLIRVDVLTASSCALTVCA